MNKFWTYGIAWEAPKQDFYDTKEEAEKAADEEFAEHCLTLNPIHDEYFSERLELIEVEEADGSQSIINTVVTAVEYRHERSDREEHGYP